MKAKLVGFVERAWFGSPGILWVLLPLEWIYRVVIRWRRSLYRNGYLRSVHCGVPTVVVGNLTAGGSGKTPIVKGVAQFLSAHGYRVAIISRGYGGMEEGPYQVRQDDSASRVGDEALMLARGLSCAVIIGRDRVSAAALAKKQGAQVVVSDDGLQHYALKRDVEIIAIDNHGRFGNGHRLPVGPLREPESRLQEADFVLERSGGDSPGNITYRPDSFLNRRSGTSSAVEDGASVLLSEHSESASDMVGAGSHSNPSKERESLDGRGSPAITVHALAAIARPARFFDELKQLGLRPIEHSYPDHSIPSADELARLADLPLIMTEKDHVKLPIDIHPNSWVLLMRTVFPQGFEEQLLGRLKALGAEPSSELASASFSASGTDSDRDEGAHR